MLPLIVIVKVLLFLEMMYECNDYIYVMCVQ